MERQPHTMFIAGLSASIGVMLGLAIWNGAQRASASLAILLVSFFVAAAVEPSVNRLEARGWRRGLSTGLILGGTLGAVTAAVVLVGAGAAGQLSDLREALPGLGTDLERLASERFGADIQLDGVVARLQKMDLNAAVGDAALKGLGVIGNVLAGLLVSFYLIVDGPRLRKRLCSLLPQHLQGEVLRVWDLAVEKTGGYLASKVILAGLSALVHGVAFVLLGVPYAIPMAIWLGVVSQVVPVIGTYLAVGLPVLLALAGENPGAALGAVVVATMYQQLENSVLAPRLTGSAVKVHPAVGFVSVLVTAAAFGPAYTLLTIPVVATVQGFITAYVKTHELIDDPRLTRTGEIPVVEEPRRRIRLARRDGDRG